jgi:hypothetical protein
LLRRLYGPRWRELLEAPPGRRRRHALVTAAGLVALGAAAASAVSGRGAGSRSGKGAGSRFGRAAGSRRSARVARGVAVVAGAAWLAGTAEFAAARITPGPRTPAEVTRMVVTSVLIPPYAMAQWLCGWLTAPRRSSDAR